MRVLLALLLLASPAWAEPLTVPQAVNKLASHLPRATRRSYSKIIEAEAKRKLIDPLLVVAFIQVESSWNARAQSVTGDWGLTQCHVAKRGSARFLGREHELFDPRTNIREWCRLAAMWRAYHQRTCKSESHLWWAHLQYGYRVKDSTHARKVLRLYRLLRGEPCVT